MPVMDGFEGTKLIRRLYDEKELSGDQPFITALTAYNTDSIRERCYQSGMDFFLTKPVSVNAIKSLLSERALRHQ